MWSASRTRKARTPLEASRSLKRATVCLFHSTGRRSYLAGSGGPSSPGFDLSRSFSLAPPACFFTCSVRGGAFCIADTRFTRARKPAPKTAKLPPARNSRRGGRAVFISLLRFCNLIVFRRFNAQQILHEEIPAAADEVA